jgi:hypothetical protein
MRWGNAPLLAACLLFLLALAVRTPAWRVWRQPASGA